MTSPFELHASAATPITLVAKSTWETVKPSLPATAAQFAEANGFVGKPGQ
jgi:hypothetical protein